ncbi:MAG: pantothenate kinase [Acidobacteria bacterium]|nr:MAG: pantothenate kinase [Acidobacteriota bacterium]
MLLAVDIGNSAIKFGLFEGETLTSKFSIPTKRGATSDEIKLAVDHRVHDSIDSTIVCSVVPEIDPSMRDFLRSLAESDPVFVNNSFDFDLMIKYAPLDSLGTDRLVNAFAAIERYGVPCIVCSLGTATTIDVVNADREFLGGIIAPGMDAMAEALHLKAPRLPKVAAEKRDNLLGNSTEESVQSGIYNGYVAMVEGLLERVRKEFEIKNTILTGGNAKAVALDTDVIDSDLLLNGLRILAER